MVERVKRGGAGVLIFKNGEPAAMLVAPTLAHGKVKFGAMSNDFSIAGDIIAPASPATDWDVLKK